MSGLVQCLELDRGESAEAVLSPSAVVGAFDPGDDREAELFSRVPALAVETFFCSKLKNDSMAALSAQAPTRPIDPRRPFARRVWT